MARTTFAQWVKSYVTHRRIKRSPRRPRRVPQFESLAPRITPAINAFFTGGQLVILGDAADNTIVVSRDAAGVIKVNDGAVAIRGGTPTVANTSRFQIFGLSGHDTLSLHESNGALPAANLFGGAGNDMLTGGSRDDLLFGQAGNDTMFGRGGVDRLFGGADSDTLIGGAANDLAFGESGNDTFRWDVGDGSDMVEGAAGLDVMVFNGFVTSEMFELSANGNRLRLTRNLGNIVMDVDDVEQVELNASNGQDVVTINDLTNTDVTTVNINLEAGAGGAGDGLSDTVIVNGGQSDDSFQIASFDNGARVAVAATAFPFISIKGGEAANDRLVVNTLDGDDLVDAASLAANAMGLTLNGGAGNDELSSGGGNDLVSGGTGDDAILLGTGNDTVVWASGEGNDFVEGEGGVDRLVFIGEDESEIVRLAANGNRVGVLRTTGSAGNERIDLNGVEQLDLNVLDGADTIFVNDLSATHVTTLNLNLKSSLDVADGQADAIILTGTDDDDSYQIASFDNGSRIAIGAEAFPFVNITGSDGANDRLVVNTLGGDDVVDAGSLAANAIGLTLNGGNGNDQLLTGGGNDLVTGGAGNDAIFLEAGDDTFIWNPGDGNDTVEGMAGRDTMIFNGNDTGESIDIAASGERVQFTRDVADVLMDLNGIERIDLNALGGDDRVTVNDLTGTDLSEINLNLSGTVEGIGGDGQIDSVIVNGTNEADLIPILGNSGGVLVNGDFLNGGGLAATVLIRAVEATDTLRINGAGGNDTIRADGLETLVNFSADGGDGDDVLIGGPGDDTLIGGSGLDILDGGPGNNLVVQD